MSRMQTVLVPYLQARAGRRFRPLLMIGLAIYAVLTGIAVAILPAQLLLIPALPILISVGFILWLLPDAKFAPPVGALSVLLAWYVGANVMWPNYLALDIPGLPWINPARIIMFAMLAIATYSFSSSSEMRAQVADSLRALPWMNRAFWIFWAVTLGTLVFSSQPFFSFSKWINNQIFWTFTFVLSVWLCATPGVMNRIFKVIVWTTLLISLEGIYEFSIGTVPWANHIPSFLKVDSSFLAKVLDGQMRAGTDVYRARGTFNVSLVFAEYLGIVYPFMIHAMMIARRFWQKVLLFGGLVAALAAMWLTNARSGMIGFFLSVFLYGVLYAIRHWRRERHSLIGISALSLMPFVAMIFMALVFTWPRLHNMTIGGGQHQNSTLARDAQWASGMPKVLSNPVGHGAGMAAQVLGYTNLGGEITIDTYYLSLLLEYGPIGLFVFLYMFGWQLKIGVRQYMTADDPEELLSGPTAVAITNFLVIKSVLSSEFNLPIAFIFLGFLFAIEKRQAAKRALPAVDLRHANRAALPMAQAGGLGAQRKRLMPSTR